MNKLTTVKTADELKQDFKNVMLDESAGQDQAIDAMVDYCEAISQQKADQVRAEYAELKDVTDEAVLRARGIYTLTNQEKRFYNDLQKATLEKNDSVIFPETIIERVFDDLQKDHPIMNLINFTPSTYKAKVVRARRSGVAVFGAIHMDLQGQLNAEFDSVELTQLALTAFFPVSNDTLDLGPQWVDRFVRLCLSEALLDAWEKHVILGTGVDQPIGLLRDPDTSGFPEKTSSGTLTFKDAPTIVKELAKVMKDMSTYTYRIGKNDSTGEKKQRKVAGKLYFVINPVNYYDIVARVTTQNANGVFVSNLPFVSEDKIIESEYVPENKLIVAIEGEYDATTSRPEKINVYDQTLALKRSTLYAIDMLGNGRPANNDTAKVYDLKIPTIGAESGEH